MSLNVVPVVKNMVKNLQQGLVQVSIGNKDAVGSYVISKESFSADDINLQNYKKQAEQIGSIVMDAISGLEISAEDYSAQQVMAAKKIAACALNPNKFIAKLRTLQNETGTPAVAVRDLVPFDELNMISQEAYDGRDNDNCFLYSVAYNFIASKQDEFGEAFYPTIVIDPVTNSINMEIKFASLMNEFQRGISGAPNQKEFNKIPLPKAIYNPDVFATDKNRLLPIVRTESEVNLLVSEKRQDESLLEKVITAPLLFGKSINLLGISQTESQLSRGQADHTDALDPAIQVQNIYLSFTSTVSNAEVSEIFKFNVSNLGSNNFVANPQNHNKDLILNFNNQYVLINTSSIKTSKGVDSAIFGQLAPNYTIKLAFDISGTSNTQSGDVKLYGNDLRVIEVRNAANDIIDPTESEFTAITAVIEKYKFLGYDLLAYSTNSNLRKRGQLITVDSFKQDYVVPCRSGIMTMVPVNNDTGTDNDTDPIVGQAQACGAKISMDAVLSLLNHVDFMRTLTADGTMTHDLSIDGYGFKGVGRNILNPVYHHSSLNIPEMISSLKSKDRDEDLKAMLIQQIRNIGMKLWIQSNYGVVYRRVLNANITQRATLIIGTDPNIERLLVTEIGANKFNIGPTFDVLIVSTFNQKMEGKMIMSFGIFDDSRNTTQNPLNFGNCAFAPNIVYDLTRDINGQTSREKHTNPRYLHITHLPIIACVDVTGVEQGFGQIALKTTTI